MGKNLIQQARGKGGPRYRAPSFRYEGRAAHRDINAGRINGIVIDIVKCQGHSAPLAKIDYEDGKTGLMIAPEGIQIGSIVKEGIGEMNIGNTFQLRDLPDGTLINNIESVPGDGGKFCRASGTFARVLTHIGEEVMIELPSKKQKSFDAKCRAVIGIIAGGGRTEKPFLKVGTKLMRKRITNKRYPMISGSAQNAVDHPFGNKRTARKSKARPVSRNAPPGRKVGMIAARRTGRKVHKVNAEGIK